MSDGLLVPRKTYDTLRRMAQDHAPKQVGKTPPPRSGPPPVRATLSGTVASGGVGDATMLGSGAQVKVYNPGSDATGDVPIYFTAGTEVSADNGDDPLRPGQWEIVTTVSSSLPGYGFPPNTPYAACGCDAYVEGTLTHSCNSICCYINVLRDLHPPSFLTLGGVSWPEAGVSRRMTYSHACIWFSEVFNGPTVTVSGEEVHNTYRWKIDLATGKLTLEVVDAVPGVPIIQIEACKTTACGADGADCQGPWIFKRGKFKNVSPPGYCEICCNPVATGSAGCAPYSLPLVITVTSGKHKRTLYYSSNGGNNLCAGDIACHMWNERGYHFPENGCDEENNGYTCSRRLELSCWGDGTSQLRYYPMDFPYGDAFVYSANTSGGVPWLNPQLLTLSAITIPGVDAPDCTDPEGTFEVEGETFGCTASVAGVGVAYTSGHLTEPCVDAEPDPCEDAECVREVAIVGGVKVYVDSDESTCEGCGSCSGTPCNPFTDDECGNADTHDEGYLCRKPCMPDAELPETVSLTFTEYMVSCPCGSGSMDLCLDEGDGHYRGSNVLCGAGHSWEYYEDGGLWYLVRDGAATASSADPAGPFLFGEVPGGDPCGSLAVTVS